MLVATSFKNLPDDVHGLEFLVDWISMPGFRSTPSMLREVNRVFTIDTSAGLGADSLISGHVIVRDQESGGLVSLLRNDFPVLIDVYAEPFGIFMGGRCVVLAEEVSDDEGRWYYWRYTAGKLLEQALAVLGEK